MFTHIITNAAAFAAELLLCVWPFWDIEHESVKLVNQCREKIKLSHITCGRGF